MVWATKRAACALGMAGTGGPKGRGGSGNVLAQLVCLVVQQLREGVYGRNAVSKNRCGVPPIEAVAGEPGNGPHVTVVVEEQGRVWCQQRRLARAGDPAVAGSL